MVDKTKKSAEAFYRTKWNIEIYDLEFEKKHSDRLKGKRMPRTAPYNHTPIEMIRFAESYAKQEVKKACRDRDEDLIKKLNDIHKKLHDRKLVSGRDNLGLLIHCLENPEPQD